MRFGRGIERLRTLCTAAAIAACGLFAPAAFAQGPAPGEVVISQVYGGLTSTGFANAPRADYIELFNRTATAKSLAGYSIAVATTSTSSTWAQHNLSGTIQPFSYYLIRVSADSTLATTIPLPGVDEFFNGTPSAASGNHIGTTSGKAVLRSVTTIIGAVACPTLDSTVIDLVAWGTTSTTCREGAANAPAGTQTASPFSVPTRKGGGCVDTDQNGNDFEALPFNPRWSGSTPQPGCVFGACCLTDGTCASTTASGCSGVFQGNNTACGSVSCPPAGACCNINTGACANLVQSACGAGSTWSGGATCAANPCSPTGACCSPAGTCSTGLTQTGCLATSGASYLGNGATCTTGVCGSTTTVACCFTNGTCCAYTSAGCAAAGGTEGTSTTCTAAGTCLATAPANDLCINAATLSLGVPVLGSTVAATTDGVQSVCITVASTKGVWYKFTPAATGVYEINGCGSTFDAVLQVWQIPDCAVQAGWIYMGCDDDRCDGGAAEGQICTSNGLGTAPKISGVQLFAGVTYHIHVHGRSTGTGGNFRLVVNSTPGVAAGACCIATTAECLIRTQTGCTTNVPAGTYQGDASLCSPSPCAFTGGGACCLSGGVCVTRQSSNCASPSIYQGDGTVCGPNPCITGACCSSTAACTVTLPPPNGCTTANSVYQGDGIACTPTNPCPPAGACCNSGACAVRLQSTCTSPATWQGGGTTCTAGICPAPPVPDNDECPGPALSLNVVTSGYTSTATPSTTATLCTASPTDVFYTFTPTTTGNYVFTMTPQIASASASLSVGTICPTFDDNLFCQALASTPIVSTDVPIEAGRTVHIRVGASTSTTTGATFSLVVAPGSTAPAGACCSSAGLCTYVLATACTGTSTYQGDGVSCTPSPCPAAGSCCVPCTFTCTITTEANCASPNLWTSGPTTCTPNPCSPVTNDAPCGAIPLTLNSTVTGVLVSATSTDDGPAGTCQATGNKGVWYKFTPAEAGSYGFSTCGATFDSILTVFSGDCATPGSLTEVACDDDTCPGSTGGDVVVCGTGAPNAAAANIPSVALQANVTYLVRVQVFSTGNGGTFPMTVTQLATGSCCAADGTCSVISSIACPTGAPFFPGGTCSADCPSTGACCAADGTCTAVLQFACTGTSVWSAGSCTPNPCPQPPLGACCAPDGSCSQLNVFQCSAANGAWLGGASTCVGVTCPVVIISSLSGGNSGLSADLDDGRIKAMGFTMPAGPNYRVSSIDLVVSISATTVTPLVRIFDHVNGTDLPGNLVGTLVTQPIAVTGTQTITASAVTPITLQAGQIYWVVVYDTESGGGSLDWTGSTVQPTGLATHYGSRFNTATGPNPPNNTTTSTTENKYALRGLAVTDVRCCRGATCAVIASSACTAPGGAAGLFNAGPGDTCNPTGNTDSPCCLADYNKLNNVDLLDIFAFLEDWFNGSPFANHNGDANASGDLLDIFSFLGDWFMGPCL